MIEIHDRIYIAGDYACPMLDRGDKWAIVHACKHPCHQNAVGYKGNLHKDHPHYLVLEKESDLFLNMIDPPVPLFKPELFAAAMRFAERHWSQGKNVLFHCNEGRSRAPSLAMLFMSKKIGVIDDRSFEAARAQFTPLYEIYLPGRGITSYMTDHWNTIGA